MKVVFAGGGTMGSVSPLVGIYQGLKDKDPQLEILWLGTTNGPEVKFLAQYSMPYRSIISGKLRQYFSLANLFTPFLVLLGLIQSFFILKKFKPDVVLSAGSFVSVPVVYAASLLKIPRFIHQQDLEKGLANKLMQKKATAITVSLEESLEIFPAKKTYWTGNPVRQAVLSGDKQRAIEFFKLNSDLDTILIFGGGQGAQLINQMILESIDDLTKKYQVIHLTGKDKSIKNQFFNYYDRQTLKRIESRYHGYEFLNKEIFDAYAVADLVVCRAGFSSLTELSALGKASLLIPIPGHQEINAQYFAKHNAVKILDQKQLTSDIFLKRISALMDNPADREQLSRNISTVMHRQATQKYIDLIYKILDNNNNK